MICDLTINLLGHVEIYRDPSYQLPPDAWTTRRARDILCYIATSKYRRVPKDVLVEAFWNGEDLQTIEKNFHPTISHIRKALNLSQPFKQNFLVFRDGAYQLNPDLVYSIDTEEFEKLISQAEAAKREKDAERLRDCLEAAHKLYRGDFMSGVYEEWAEERRNFYSEQFVRICGALAKLNFGEKRWSAALANAKEVLAIDPFREDMHRMMLKILAAQGKTSSVRKHYEELAALLKTELGVEPAAQTVTVYRELVK
jgi:DNA-binding SARP family transcriptional activator